MAEKKYFWLKLKDDFFDEKYIKALRRLPQGDSLVIVYLKMQLKSLKTEGLIKYEQILPDSVSELAMLLDEDENIVRLAIEALIKFGVIERWADETFYMLAMQDLIGSETAEAVRVRKHRALKKQATNGELIIQCNPKTLQCNADVTSCNADVTKCNTEIDIEKDIDIDIERDIEKIESAERKNTNGTKSGQCPTTTTTNRKRFTPPTLQEVQDYCNERGNGLSAESFIDYYTANGWRVGKNPMKDWKACVRTWERTEYNRKSGTESKKGVTFYELGKERGIFKDEF